MIGTIVSWGRDFLTVSTKTEVYRTEGMPDENNPVDAELSLEAAVEFDVVNNRAVNVKRVYFAPNVNALQKSIHTIQVFNEDKDLICNEIEDEGSLHYQSIGRMNAKLTRNKNELDTIMPIMKKLGLNMCIMETKPIRLTVMDGNKPVDVYDHSFQVGIISTFTRVTDESAEKQAWAAYDKFANELCNQYYKNFFETVEIVDIQRKLYFGSSLSRKYNQFKYRDSKYDYAKI